MGRASVVRRAALKGKRRESSWVPKTVGCWAAWRGETWGTMRATQTAALMAVLMAAKRVAPLVAPWAVPRACWRALRWAATRAERWERALAAPTDEKTAAKRESSTVALSVRSRVVHWVVLMAESPAVRTAVMKETS